MTEPRKPARPGVRHAQIKALLLRHPDGIITNDLAAAVGINRSQVFALLNRQPAPWAYIDRWTVTSPNAGWAAVWCYCDVPTRNVHKPLMPPSLYWRQIHGTGITRAPAGSTR